MRAVNLSGVGFGQLVASWVTLSGSVLAASLFRALGLAGCVGEAFKDAVLDLGVDGREDGQAGEPLAATLPPLDAERFMAALRGPAEETLRQAADAINEDAGGNWSALTRQRLQALFAELADEALRQALDLRVAAAEAELPAPRTGGDWVKRYRRMLAETGRWPPDGEPADSPRVAG